MRYNRNDFENLPNDVSDEQIEMTVEALKRHHYDPILILDAPNFLSWKKSDLLKEYDRLMKLKPEDKEVSSVADYEPQEVIEKQISLLHYNYELLCRLRDEEAEAWDLVNELYEDD